MFNLNMADAGTTCPANWTLHEGLVRGCGRKTDYFFTCDSVLLPVTMSYSLICGRIYAYQKGDSLAFLYSVDFRPTLGVDGIEHPYVSGLSLTHGEVGQRKHVWTFAGADHETESYSNNASLSYSHCPCIDPALTWPFQIPSYVGDSYFCDTGARTSISSNTLYMDDPLWDGEGCGGASTCCSFNSPPWFCQHLNYHTSDDLELRLCSSWESGSEDKLISLVEIYIK